MSCQSNSYLIYYLAKVSSQRHKPICPRIRETIFRHPACAFRHIVPFAMTSHLKDCAKVSRTEPGNTEISGNTFLTGHLTFKSNALDVTRFTQRARHVALYIKGRYVETPAFQLCRSHRFTADFVLCYAIQHACEDES
jgi:hypothetical protein